MPKKKGKGKKAAEKEKPKSAAGDIVEEPPAPSDREALLEKELVLEFLLFIFV